MKELNSREFLFLKRVADRHGIASKTGIDLYDLKSNFCHYHLGNYEVIEFDRLICELTEKDILNFSPDGTRFKLSDYGAQLFYNEIKEEENWINQGPFIKLNSSKKEEINIKKNEYFKGYWEVISILKKAKNLIKIQDPYIGINTLAMLNELESPIEIQILTTDKNWKDKETSFISYSNFKKQWKGKIELKTNTNVHSRRIILDDLEVYSSDDSFKDLGLHESAKIKRLANVEEEIKNFNLAWTKGLTL